MCSGSKREVCPIGAIMEGEIQKQNEGFACNFSILLEFAACNDVDGFRHAVEDEGSDVDELSLWYGRGIGSRKMGLEERTPLMISAMFGSEEVVKYILSTGCVDVNRACSSDGATALHCAASGGSSLASRIVKLLVDASADINSVDANGRLPADVMVVSKNSSSSSRKALEMLLKGSSGVGEGYLSSEETEGKEELMQTPQKDGNDKKEYPIDLTLPDIKNGIYGTDEFRMYTFKVKPCSRAYSHDWTECPFVHPGENARRRDPRKYHYSCVPCPEFRKGTCRQGDNCEYAHGVFECWLHPAQYRTRLCKDEVGCTRRVCFFAHKPEELRPLYASTGSAVPSPRSASANSSSFDMSAISPMALGSPSALMIPTSTPPMSPSAATSSPMGAMWNSQASFVPPTLQLPGSRLKTAINARDMDFDMDMLSLEREHRKQQQQQQALMDEIANMSPHANWSNSLATAAALAASSGGRAGEYSRLGGVKPTNLDDLFGSLDPSMLSQLQGFALKTSASQMQSPTGAQMRQSMNQLRSSYPGNLSSSPVRSPSSFSLDPSSAAAMMSSRSAAFAKRSQSFIDRGALNRHLGASPTSGATMSPTFSDWSSPTGKLDWGIQGEELNKLRKSASFGFRSSNPSSTVNMGSASMGSNGEEPDVSWVQSLVKDVQPAEARRHGLEETQQYHLNSGGSEMLPQWVEQLYMEQEQMVA